MATSLHRMAQLIFSSDCRKEIQTVGTSNIRKTLLPPSLALLQVLLLSPLGDLESSPHQSASHIPATNGLAGKKGIKSQGQNNVSRTTCTCS